jgi:hypothetical protein
VDSGADVGEDAAGLREEVDGGEVLGREVGGCGIGRGAAKRCQRFSASIASKIRSRLLR